MNEFTRLLEAWSDGDESAHERLFELIYPELHRLAAAKLFAEPSPPSIQATELVNEAYLKLIGQAKVQWQNRAHFLALSATLIRRILLDRAKSRGRSKRGSGVRPLSLELVDPLAPGQDIELLALDQALDELARIRPDIARLVELRYFGGLSVEETATVLGQGKATVVRRWRFAKAWLAQRLGKNT